MIHHFQDSLIGAYVEWYMQLEHINIHNWVELADTFAEQYKYNTYMAPNHTQLQNMAQKDIKSFKEYMQCLRELVARMDPLLIDCELIDIFISTL